MGHNEHGTTRSFPADEPSLSYSLEENDSEEDNGQVLQGLVANLREDLNYLKRRIRDRLRHEKGKDRMGAPDHLGNSNMGRSGTLQHGELQRNTFHRSSTKLPTSSTEFYQDRARSSTTALTSSTFISGRGNNSRDKIRVTSMPPRHSMPPIQQGSAIELPKSSPLLGGGIGSRGKSSAL